eukprot:jgi/Botrbrau1/11353/Bobra.0038s0108.1
MRFHEQGACKAKICDMKVIVLSIRTRSCRNDRAFCKNESYIIEWNAHRLRNPGIIHCGQHAVILKCLRCDMVELKSTRSGLLLRSFNY